MIRNIRKAQVVVHLRTCESSSKNLELTNDRPAATVGIAWCRHAHVWAIAILVAVYFQVAQLETAILALAVCVISSQLAHIAGEYPSGDDYFMARLASSISVRTGIPLLAVVLVKLSPIIPFEPAFVFLVILFYLVGLFADVALHVARLKPGRMICCLSPRKDTEC